MRYTYNLAQQQAFTGVCYLYTDGRYTEKLQRQNIEETTPKN